MSLEMVKLCESNAARMLIDESSILKATEKKITLCLQFENMRVFLRLINRKM
jgi:hypothetical protein